MKNNKYEWFALAVALAVMLSVFFGCNVVNHHKSSVKENLDSTAVHKQDSGHVISKDSTATDFTAKTASSVQRHKKEKQIEINFDTATNYGNGSSFDYSIGGTIIKTPQKIKSAVIEDNSEDEASSTNSELKKDSVQVKLLDSNTHSTYDSTRKKEDVKTIDKTKDSIRTSPLLIGGILLLIIVACVIGGRKLGFFKF